MNSIKLIIVSLSLFLFVGCVENSKLPSFGNDWKFLSQHTDAVLLTSEDGKEKIIVVPEYQGRVMTSSLDGDEGISFGWVNYDLIKSGKTNSQFNAFGGEERLWIAPEGGQFSIFNDVGSPFDIEHWRTPAIIDTEPFEVIETGNDYIKLSKDAKLTNWSGTSFDFRMDRDIRILGEKTVASVLGVKIPQTVSFIGFLSNSSLTNTGKTKWQKEKGLISLWILGQFHPNESTTVVIPFIRGSEKDLGPVVNDMYFGKVPSDRLIIGDGVLYFKGDAKYRSKIGLTPLRAKNVLGSYDSKNKILTIVYYNKPDGELDYLNNMWQIHDEPYRGDVIMGYNDGPLGPGKEQLCPVYELETTSPARELIPGETIEHLHYTFHFSGLEEGLDEVSRKVLGVGLSEISRAFKNENKDG